MKNEYRNSKKQQNKASRKAKNKACWQAWAYRYSLENDKRIKVTAKGVNAINREFEYKIDLHAIRKLKFDKFKDDFDYDISPFCLAQELR